jgi:uncharacterized protein (DUF1697 family)
VIAILEKQRDIVLLCGINVGGTKKFPKAEQLQMLQDLGFENPQVYIHTGNWIFESSYSMPQLRLKIVAAITEKFEWEVPVLVLTKLTLQQIFESCPFSEEKKENSYFTVLAEPPSKDIKALFKEISFPEEEFYLIGNCVYFYATISAGRVKLNNNLIERKLKVCATSRNFKTMNTLVSLSE